MKDYDAVLKNLLKDKVKFADLFNGILFRGEAIIKPDGLQELNIENVFIKEDEQSHIDILRRYRDLQMKYSSGVFQVIFGCENQTAIDYAMPIRTMMYDALAYEKQRKELEMELQKENGKMYRTKMKKGQKIDPVITIVLYFGEKEWDGARSMHEMIQWPEGIDIRGLVPDYKMNFVYIRDLEDMKIFQSDLQYIFSMIKYSCDKKTMLEYAGKHQKELDQLDLASKQTIVTFLNDERLEKIFTKKKEEFHMCKALDDLWNDGVSQGISQGIQAMIQENLEEGKTMKQICQKIQKYFHLAESEAESHIEKYKSLV